MNKSKSDILDLLEQGTPLRNEIQNLMDTICKSGPRRWYGVFGYA